MCTGTIHMHCGKKKRSCLICLDFFPHHRAESVSTSGEWPETRFPAISRTTQSAFPLVPRLRPGLEKLKTEAGGCIKVHSGKLLNKLDIWYGYINLDPAPRNSIDISWHLSIPLSRIGYLRSVFRDGAGIQWSGLVLSLVGVLMLVISPLHLKVSQSPCNIVGVSWPKVRTQNRVSFLVRIAQHLLPRSHGEGSSS